MGGRFAYVNPEAVRLFGGTSASELVGRSVLERVPPEFQEKTRGRLRELNEERRAVPPLEQTCLRLDGSRFWAEFSAIPFAHEGRSGALVFARDVTPRKVADEERARLRRAVETSGEIVFLTNPQGVITYVNPEFTHVYGYSAEEVVGRETPRVLKSGVVPPEQYELFWRRLLAEKLVKGEFVNRTRDGRLIDVEASVSAILDEGGRVGGFLAVQRDVTERKRSERALKESERRYQRLVGHIQDALLVDDRQGRIVYANRRFLDLFGFREEELPSLRLEDYVAPEFRAELRDRHDRRIRGESVPTHYEYEGVRRDGSRLWLVADVSPIVDDGGITGTQSMIRDVTEIRRRDEQYRQAQRLEAIGRLAGGVAHDFNNLLTVIGGYADLLLKELRPGDSAREHAVEISLAADRAASLTRQLLAFSRKQVLAPRNIDLNATVSQTRSLLGRLIGEDIEIVAKLHPAGCFVRADPVQLEQVLMNLAVNARDAMPGGGRLTLETGPVELDEAYARTRPSVVPGRYAMLAVSDSGTGMDAETLSHIFEPFFTTKERGKGTGLGLATVFGVVKQSGGDIWVYSIPGRGTTFKIFLPLVDRASGEIDRRAPSDVVQGLPNRTVMVVEDEDAVRSLAVAVLESAGYRVLAPRTAAEALELAAHHPGPIDLLVSDVVMPVMNGPELAPKIQALRPAIGVLFMSGYSDEASISRAIASGGASFLQKPFSPSSLSRKIRELLERPPGGAAPSSAPVLRN